MRKIGKFFFLPIFLRNLFLFIHIFQKNSLFFYNIHFYFISNSQNNHTFTLYYSHSKRKTVFKQNSKKVFHKKIHSPIKFGLTYISFFIFYSFLLEHPSLGCSNFFTVYQSNYCKKFFLNTLIPHMRIGAIIAKAIPTPPKNPAHSLTSNTSS